LPRKKIEKPEEILSEEAVWDIIQFARNLSNGGYGMGIVTPDLLVSRLRDITMNPQAATQDSLDKALADPKNSEIELQGFSESFELTSQPYKRLLSFLGNLLSWDLTYTCTNATFKDYSGSKYQKDLQVVGSFLDKFDYKKEFSTVVREMLRNEAYFCAPRFDGNKYVLQELPAKPDYTKITGRWDYGLLFSINMYWFILPGISLDMYPKFFAQKYMELWGGENAGNTGIRPYNPAMPPELRGQSSWVLWQDVPVDVGWVFKLNPEVITRVPYFSPLFNDLILQALMRNLQKNINMSTASRLLLGQVGKLKDTSVKERNQFDISPDLLGKFLALVKSAIADSIKVAAAPLENLQSISFPAENEVYDSYLKTALASSGVNTNLIFTSNMRPNIMETQLSLNADEQLMMALYPQFSSFLEYQINKLTKYFKFKFEFEGSQFFNNREQRFDKQMTLLDKGIVLPHKIAASLGMSPQDFLRQLDEARANGFVDNLTPIVSAFQMSGKGGETGKAGRPQKSESDLGDSGEQTKSDGENIGRGGKS
jgi:hypothetical protein